MGDVASPARAQSVCASAHPFSPSRLSSPPSRARKALQPVSPRGRVAQGRARSGLENKDERSGNVMDKNESRKRPRSTSSSPPPNAKRMKVLSSPEPPPLNGGAYRGDERGHSLLFSLSSVASSLSPSCIMQESVTSQPGVARTPPSRPPSRRKKATPCSLSSLNRDPVVQWFTRARNGVDSSGIEVPGDGVLEGTAWGSALLRQWECEHFCSEIDAVFFDDQEFENYLYSFMAVSPDTPLAQRQWVTVRRMLGVPRRFSTSFVQEEREKLHRFRLNATKIRANEAPEVVDNAEMELLARVPPAMDPGTPVLYLSPATDVRVPTIGNVSHCFVRDGQLLHEVSGRVVPESDVLPLVMVSESTSRVSQAPSEPLDTLAFVAAETSQQWAQAHENIMQVNALLQRKDTVLTQLAAVTADSQEATVLRHRLRAIDGELQPCMQQFNTADPDSDAMESDVSPPHPFLRLFPIGEQLVSYAFELYSERQRQMVEDNAEACSGAPACLNLQGPEEVKVLTKKLMAACVSLVLHIQSFAKDTAPMGVRDVEQAVDVACTVIRQSIPRTSDDVALEYAPLHHSRLSAPLLFAALSNDVTNCPFNTCA